MERSRDSARSGPGRPAVESDALIGNPGVFYWRCVRRDRRQEKCRPSCVDRWPGSRVRATGRVNASASAPELRRLTGGLNNGCPLCNGEVASFVSSDDNRVKSSDFTDIDPRGTTCVVIYLPESYSVLHWPERRL